MRRETTLLVILGALICLHAWLIRANADAQASIDAARAAAVETCDSYDCWE